MTRQPRTTIETITPEQAQHWLQENKSNRMLRDTVLRRYAADMATGRWYVTGAAVVFDHQGQLRDGQHRLAACVIAGVPFTTVVLRDVEIEAQTAMDTGLKRSFADVLHMRGEKDCHSLAGVITLSWRWQHDPNISNRSMFPTTQQLLDWLRLNPSIREATRQAQHVRKVVRMPTSAAGSFIYRIHQVSTEDAKGFLHQLMEGAGLVSGDPILALRNWAFNQLNNKKPDALFYLAVSIKAWNAWVENRSVGHLVWRRGGVNREAFPTLVDVDGRPFSFEHEVTAGQQLDLFSDVV